MNWKQHIKQVIPPSILNSILLTFPFLYRTQLVCYESNLQASGGLDDLLSQLKPVLYLEGNIAECGSSRCGTSIIMANYLRSHQVQKTIYALDSFEGFDRVELERDRKLGLTTASEDAFTSTSYNYVKTKIEKLGVADVVVPIEGFFRDTLPHIESNQLCFALIDCDLKDSIIYCAETIWPKLASRGRIVFDDYTAERYKGARLGIDFFVDTYADEISEHGLMNRLYYVCKE